MPWISSGKAPSEKLFPNKTRLTGSDICGATGSRIVSGKGNPFPSDWTVLTQQIYSKNSKYIFSLPSFRSFWEHSTSTVSLS